MVAEPLTDRQAELLALIRRYWLEHQRPPTYRELAAGLGGVQPNAVVQHLKILVRKGAVEWQPESSRGIWPAGLRARIRAAVQSTMPEQSP
jgi:SOS-response transcriptional repressor LexA